MRTLAPVLLAAALAGTAFAADGGLRLGRTTWTEIAIILIGSALAALALLVAPLPAAGRSSAGVLTLALLGLLVVLTGLSVLWSLQPSDSWLELNRSLAYLAAFAAVLGLARIAPRSWRALVVGVALACVVVTGWALATVVFPGALNPDEQFARLREPFGYWNSVGLMAALGVAPLLWIGARREGSPAVRALALPGLGLLLVAVMLAYSRGALLALALGLAFWFATVPVRLRGAAVLLPAVAAAAAVVAWAFGQGALTTDRVLLFARIDAGQELGLLLALQCVVLYGVGLAGLQRLAERPPSAPRRALAARVLVAALLALPVAGVVALAASQDGLGGSISNTWDELTSEEAGTPANDPGRLTATASVRARYWREAGRVWEEHPVLGAGAGAYATARDRHRTGTLDVRHAHGFVAQTLADLGLVGLAVALAAALAWLLAAGRATALRRRDRGRRAPERTEEGAERLGLLTLTAVVVVFAVSSLVDWTWFVPGNALVALVCAAWVAGVAPWRERDAGPRSRRRPGPARLLAAATVIVLGVAGAWATLQPLRSVNAGNAALERLSRGAIEPAREIALIGADRNPLSVEPLFELAVIEDSAGNRAAALRALERAVQLQPANPETWQRLGEFRLNRMRLPTRAVPELRAALWLDPRSRRLQQSFLDARRQANGVVAR